MDGPVDLTCADPLFDSLYENKKLQKAANDCAVTLMMNLKMNPKVIRLYDELIIEYFRAYCELIRKSERCEILREHTAKDTMIKVLLAEKVKGLV